VEVAKLSPQQTDVFLEIIGHLWRHKFVLLAVLVPVQAPQDQGELVLERSSTLFAAVWVAVLAVLAWEKLHSIVLQPPFEQSGPN
jgi:hypothetical protein